MPNKIFWRTVKIGAAAVVGGTVAVAAAPVVLTAAGFTSAGIAAGSLAASMMSSAAIASGGGVAAGSAVAILQSAGAAGLGMVGSTVVGSVGAAVAAGGTAVYDVVTQKNKRSDKGSRGDDVDQGTDSDDDDDNNEDNTDRNGCPEKPAGKISGRNIGGEEVERDSRQLTNSKSKTPGAGGRKLDSNKSKAYHAPQSSDKDDAKASRRDAFRLSPNNTPSRTAEDAAMRGHHSDDDTSDGYGGTGSELALKYPVPCTDD